MQAGPPGVMEVVRCPSYWFRVPEPGPKPFKDEPAWQAHPRLDLLGSPLVKSGWPHSSRADRFLRERQVEDPLAFCPPLSIVARPCPMWGA